MASSTICSVSLTAQYPYWYYMYYSLYVTAQTGHRACSGLRCRGRLQRAGLYPPLQRPTTVRCTRECDWLCVTAAHTRLGDDYIRRPHLGHAHTAVLADATARWHRMLGRHESVVGGIGPRPLRDGGSCVSGRPFC